MPKNKCVVVKTISRRNYGDNSVKVMENLQKEVEKSKRKHIVEMLDYGDSSFDNMRVLIMEKGRESLENKLKNRQMLDEKEVRKMAMEMALALRDFHQIGIHLDFKPANLVYFTDEESGEEVLKLIDFDGSHWIGHGNNGTEDADQNEMIQFGNVTPIRYKSPEQFQKEKLISRKTDIWSFGASLYQIILCFTPKAILANIMQLILNLYRGLELIDDKNHTERIKKTRIKDTLTFWNFYPTIMRLIRNVLQINPEKRLSAKGIVHYLNGSCELAEFLSNEKKDPREITIFNETKVKDLEEIILKKYGQETELYEMLQKMVEKQQKLLLAEQNKLEKCDTKSILFD